MMNRNNSDIWLNKHNLPLSNKLSSEKNKLFLTILVIWVKFMISGRSVTGKFAAAGNRRLIVIVIVVIIFYYDYIRVPTTGFSSRRRRSYIYHCDFL
jgi:hypothetical protein